MCNHIVSTGIRSLILHSTAILNTATVNLSQSNLVAEEEKSTQTAYQSQITDLKAQLAELLKQEAEAVVVDDEAAVALFADEAAS